MPVRARHHRKHAAMRCALPVATAFTKTPSAAPGPSAQDSPRAGITLFVDGSQVTDGHVERTHGIMFWADETANAGFDARSQVSDRYSDSDSRFTGDIESVQIGLGDDKPRPPHQPRGPAEGRDGPAVGRLPAALRTLSRT
jgi:hypothetical protein